MTRNSDLAEWLIVLRADGVVDSVEGAPPTWVGHTLAEIPGTAGVLRRAAAALIHAPPTSNVRRRKVHCLDGEEEVEAEILLIEALPLRRAPTRVQELVMRTIELFAGQAQSNKIDLTVEQGKDVPALVALDGEKVAWALSTLVINALRYARAHLDVSVGWEDASSELVIAVSDDGPGIPKDKLQWLFERNPQSGQYAGLALPMVRDVMAAHRGSVTVKNRVGSGSTFTMRLPRVLPESPKPS